MVKFTKLEYNVCFIDVGEVENVYVSYHVSTYTSAAWESATKMPRALAESCCGYVSPVFEKPLPPLMYRFLNRANGKEVVVRGYEWRSMVDAAALHIGLPDEKSYTAMSYRLDPSDYVEGAIVMKPKRKNKKKNAEDEDDE